MTNTATNPATQQVRGACPHDCPDTCALVTTVESGVAIRVAGNPDHRHTDGALCTKVSRYAERTYHPERLLTPLKRSGPKGSGQFEPVGWDEALDDIATRLKAEAPSARLSVTGHTDSVGADAYNDKLSLRRAESVAAYLVSQGVAADKVKTAGLGESQPLADNGSDAGRAQNRRVEIFVDR